MFRTFSPSGKLKGALALLALCLLPAAVSAAEHSGETVDKIANFLAWFIVIVMPIAGIVVFWKVHILPEKIAERRHHPQKDAIQVLCLLSLVFGGLLWPIAWLWAYTRPTSSYMVYGTEKHEDYFHEKAEEWRAGKLSAADIEELREELDAMASKAPLPTRLKALRRELAAAQNVPVAQASSAAPTVSGGAV
jgi:hypothetical protein